jgi:hypothetical protein
MRGCGACRPWVFVLAAFVQKTEMRHWLWDQLAVTVVIALMISLVIVIELYIDGVIGTDPRK